jgi:hypothetical protein
MNKAFRAKTPGDKIYHLERIHSKIVYMSRNELALLEKDDKQIPFLLQALEKIEKGVICFNNNSKSKRFSKYINAVQNAQTHFANQNFELFFQSAKVMHGTFMRFSKKAKHIFSNSCEHEYQDICMPIYIIEEKLKKARLKE